MFYISFASLISVYTFIQCHKFFFVFQFYILPPLFRKIPLWYAANYREIVTFSVGIMKEYLTAGNIHISEAFIDYFYTDFSVPARHHEYLDVLLLSARLEEMRGLLLIFESRVEEVTRQDQQLAEDMADLMRIVHDAINRIEAMDDDEFLRHGDTSDHQEEDAGVPELSTWNMRGK